MSFEFHHNKTEYFRHQYENTKNYVIPFIQTSFQITSNSKVLEIGCAEGGVLKAFTELGCKCIGVELSSSKVENANKFMQSEVESGLVNFICKNIYDLDFNAEFKQYFDIIILKDTIEHIPNQKKLIGYLQQIMSPNAVVFFGFPPWYMPWGGHQQICKSKVLMYLPYFHLFPLPIFKSILKIFGEQPYKIQEMIEVKETGISTARFEKICKDTLFIIIKNQFYFINPIYQYKFGWKPIKQWNWIKRIPVLRDFVSTTVFYLVQKK
ncbi:MAG: class I SAM-dependent methyltransferase [Bacteroidota bacterium]|nr:class I SAM-dependent methyltransferase [Bacteroidota bacterium]